MRRVTRSSADFGQEKQVTLEDEHRVSTATAEMSSSSGAVPQDVSVRASEASVAIRADAACSPRAASSAHFGMVAVSAAMHRVFDQIGRLANAKEPVLIIGESGCGKDLVARALHEQSVRASKPYLAINCAALANTLIESELFGYTKGAFTGAREDTVGAFQATNEGTLLLDEIGEFPLELQPKLLRVLEASSVRRIGGHCEIPINTRVIASTHRNLQELVVRGQFREDLFHRLFVLSILVPPLRERPEDVLPLARHFLSTQASRRSIELDWSAEAALLEYKWPGNIRELRNVIVRAVFMTDGDTITAQDLWFSKYAFPESGIDVAAEHEPGECEKISRALSLAGGNRAEAARLLGMSKSTFHDRLRRCGFGVKTK
jgi:DNA-binding NtrC family response regulator